MSLTILQLVPRLPPAICGVGDYALDIARQLRRDFSVYTTFLTCESGTFCDGAVDFPARCLEQRRSASLRDAVAEAKYDAIIVQYSGYGFANRGAPLWLICGLERNARPLITMFHETYATGSLRSSSFWLSPFMRILARRLASRSNFILTNRKTSAAWLGRGAIWQPVFSSLGEMHSWVSHCDRPNWLAAFPYQANGNPDYWSRLHHVATTLKIVKIIALGAFTSDAWPHSGMPPVQTTGPLPNQEVSAYLSRCRYGYFSYHPDCLGKSGILAAYCAHGLCPIIASHPMAVSDGLVLGQHILPWDCLTSVNSHDAIGTNAWQWYNAHNLRSTAAIYYALLHSLQTGCVS